MANNPNPNATGVQIFKNEEFGAIRTVDVDGEVHFVGNDVAKALGYSEPKKAVSRHCQGGTFRPLLDGRGVMQKTKVIPEGDVYRLAANSLLPGAKEFESWIFDEVLPTIRKTGAYIVPQACTDNGTVPPVPKVPPVPAPQFALFDNEDSLYDLYLSSRKPEAKAFRKWLTSEVIPAIRSKGGYILTTPGDQTRTIMSRAHAAANDAIAREAADKNEPSTRIEPVDSHPGNKGGVS